MNFLAPKKSDLPHAAMMFALHSGRYRGAGDLRSWSPPHANLAK
jgi:hypothetical protein